MGNLKSGSLSIYNTARNDLKLNCSPIKELGFLSNLYKSYKKCPVTGNFHLNQVHSLKEYYNNFSNGDFFESDPSYFFHSEEVINNLKKFKQNPKILIILRNPVYTTFSSYKHIKFNFPDAFSSDPFLKAINTYHKSDSRYSWAIKLSAQGYYYENIKNFLNSSLDITIEIFEELFSDVNIYNEKLNKFFGLNTSINMRHDHKSKIIQTLDNDSYQLIKKYYIDDIKKTSALLNIDLNKYWY